MQNILNIDLQLACVGSKTCWNDFIVMIILFVISLGFTSNTSRKPTGSQLHAANFTYQTAVTHWWVIHFRFNRPCFVHYWYAAKGHIESPTHVSLSVQTHKHCLLLSIKRIIKVEHQQKNNNRQWLKGVITPKHYSGWCYTVKNMHVIAIN